MNASDAVFLVYPALAVILVWCHYVDPTRERNDKR